MQLDTTIYLANIRNEERLREAGHHRMRSTASPSWRRVRTSNTSRQ